MFKNRPRLMGFLVGLAITIAGCVAFVLYNRSFIPELMQLDNRFLGLSSLEPDPRIVHVDIDDSALDRVGRWPWSRDKTAALIRTLHELGAKLIAVDLLIDDRETPVREDPSLRDADVEGTAAVIGEIEALIVRQTDDEMADVIRKCGSVFLSVHTGVSPTPTAPEIIRLEALWRQRPDVTPEAARRELELPDIAQSRDRVANSLRQFQIQKLLLSDFTLPEAEIASRLAMPQPDVARVLAGAKASAARTRIRDLLRERSDMTIQEVRTVLLGEHANARNSDAEDVTEAFRYARSLAAVLNRCAAAPPHAKDVLKQGYDLEPPLFYFVEASMGVGAVDFVPDKDGAVRSVPAIVEYEGRLIKHLGVAVACSMLGIRDEHIHVNADRTITLKDPSGGSPHVIPLDGEGRMLIHWTKNGSEWRSNLDFPHITAAKVWTICSARELVEENNRQIGIQMFEVVRAATNGDVGEYKINLGRRNKLAQAVRGAELRRVDSVQFPGEAPLTLEDARKEVQRLTKAIDDQEARLTSWVELQLKDLKEIQESEKDFKPNPREAAMLKAGEALNELIPRLKAANVDLEKEAEAARAQLVLQIKDKTVFVGYAATALGDIVPTPIGPQTLGVMRHAHALNTILSGRFIWRSPRPLEIAIVLALGALISFITANWTPKKALAITIAIISLYVIICLALFSWMDRWMVLAGPLIIFVTVWAFVTLFRQLTAEREKRIFAKQLGQYTSPTIAARLAANPEAAAAFKSVQTRDITVLFTDLAHFTTISENQDAETVQYVLNTYLKRMSEVIWRRRGLINKFMGDGVMAFFNPSVDPQPDHARIGVEVTLDGFDEMEKIKNEEANGPYRDLFARLGMRAGIATGICKNGDFGSELKADYTVIGDVVNLAARLEPANKVFGTQLICPAATRDRVVDHFEFRYLAELQVKGKTRTVPVYEVLGRKGAVDAAVLEYAARFEAAVALYRERKFDESIRAFMRILSRRPDDLGAARYIDACEELKSFPPGESWAGALELKEK